MLRSARFREALALLATAACGPASAPPAPPPIENVVLISIDTLRCDHVGLYGAERVATPALDDLGRGGVVFDQAVAQAPWTIPSHATMLASAYPSELGIGPYREPGRLSDAAETLAEVLRARGFATAAITGGYLSRELGFAQGFDAFRETIDEPYFAFTVTYAEDWLQRRDPARPFFLFLHTFEVHQYRPKEPFRSAWVRPYDGPLRDLESLPDLLQSGPARGRVGELGPDDWRYARDVYDACVASVDAEIGRLLGILEARGLRESTLVVVTSDHGEEFGEHGGGGHGYTLYDENLRVPLLLGHPALPARRIGAQVRLLDLAPTIADLVGAPAPAIWRGRSLRPLIEGGALDLPAFAEHAHEPLKAVRHGSAKYVVDARGPERLLFDLALDPGEHANLAAAPAWAERGTELRRSLRDFVRSTLGSEGLRAAPGSSPAGLEATLRKLGYAGAPAAPTLEPGAWLELLDDGG